MKFFIFALVLLTQSTCSVARPSVDYKALTDLIKRNQIAELRKALDGRSKEEINFVGRSTLITYAIAQRHPDAISVLLDWGIDVNRSLPFDVDGNTMNISPLIYAISSRADLPVIELLVKRGADVNKPAEMLLPLNFAISLRQYAIADFMLEQGAKADGSDGIGGMTPLMELAFYQETDVNEMKALLKKLIMKGAKVNAKGVRGATALSIAVSIGKTQLVEALLDLGANPNTVNDKGESMLVLARRKQHNDIESLLLKHGAKP